MQPQQATQELLNLNSRVVQSSATFRISRLSQMSNEFLVAATQNPIIAGALGYGFAGISVVYGLSWLQNDAFNTYYERIIKKYLDKNSNLPSETKKDLLYLNSNIFVASNLVDMTVNYYNLA